MPLCPFASDGGMCQRLLAPDGSAEAQFTVQPGKFSNEAGNADRPAWRKCQGNRREPSGWKPCASPATPSASNFFSETRVPESS
ncbi:hypothetical protein EV686_10470 [Paracandidimonas soli]|uniref:Uncharacterized protein n=1 Tax=Paracandidimonas soli TaxID=1917182 RepID=A0A4R3V5V5_9BURK|nr:hypothetical protein EV686_10470 [Paracandidimonas soli]